MENVKRGASPDLFDILELQFKSLDETEQLVFLDFALFGNEWVASVINDSTPQLEDWVAWLTGLHLDTSPESVEDIVSINTSALKAFVIGCHISVRLEQALILSSIVSLLTLA